MGLKKKILAEFSEINPAGCYQSDGLIADYKIKTINAIEPKTVDEMNAINNYFARDFGLKGDLSPSDAVSISEEIKDGLDELRENIGRLR